jgi:hypothetical protein
MYYKTAWAIVGVIRPKYKFPTVMLSRSNGPAGLDSVLTMSRRATRGY